jgi:predicted O-methyltransferase YrrM
MEEKFKKLLLKKNTVNLLTKLKNKLTGKLKSIVDTYYFYKPDRIFTHLTKPEKRLLYHISKNELRSGCTVVEIGSYLGASTSFITKGIDSQSLIYCVDTWGNHAMKYDETDVDGSEKNTYPIFRKNTQRWKRKIVMLQGWSKDMFYKLKVLTSRIDFLFIDGDHSYEGVSEDWRLYSTLLKKGSIVAFHDTGWAEGVNKVIKENVLTQPVALIFSLPNLQVYKLTDDLNNYPNS